MNDISSRIPVRLKAPCTETNRSSNHAQKYNNLNPLYFDLPFANIHALQLRTGPLYL